VAILGLNSGSAIRGSPRRSAPRYDVILILPVIADEGGVAIPGLNSGSAIRGSPRRSAPRDDAGLVLWNVFYL